MAREQTLWVVEQQERRIPLIFIVMFNNPNQIFQYNGSPITFQKGDSVMANATQMAKPFEKQPIFWLSNQSTKDYLTELSKLRNLSLADLVQVTKGGNNPGTWMHEDVALEFARWLSPAFAIWCNDRIKELLTIGVTTVSNDDEAILHAMQVLQQRVEASKRQLEIAQKQIELQDNQLKVQAPKVQYVDNVLQSVNTYTSTQMAKELGMREAERLHKTLKENNKFSFGYLWNCCTFALSNIFKGRWLSAHSRRFLCLYAIATKILRLLPPCGEVNALPTAFEVCSTTGKDSRFSVYNAKNVE